MLNLNVGLISALLITFCTTDANALTYTLSGYQTGITSGSYMYFYSGNTAYICGDEPLDSYNNIYDLSNGDVIVHSNYTYLCCNNGYMVRIRGGYGQFPSPSSYCGTVSWRSLGNNKYCQQTLTTSDWCSQANDSGTGFTDASCQYSTCYAFTHCGTGYYKADSSTCTPCPDGGTTSGITDNGKTACYLTPGSTGSDTKGTWQIVNNKCWWQN